MKRILQSVFGLPTRRRQKEALRDLEAEVERHRENEARLIESGRKYLYVLESTQEGYYEVDLNGNLIFFNPAVCRFLGYSEAELKGLNNRRLMDPETARTVFKVYNQVYQTGQPSKPLEWVLIRKDGSKCFVETSVSLMRDGHGKPVGFRGLARDISERKKIEKELRNLNEALEQRVIERTAQLEEANRELTAAIAKANKLARDAEAANVAKSAFLANMSHEIRTPLNGIIGMCELAGIDGEKEKQAEYLGIIRSSARSLLGLINDILDFSKIEAGRLELERLSFSLYELLEEIPDLFLARLGEKHLEMVIDIAPDVPEHVTGDPLRLRQVLVNLVSNALKFTEKGEVHLSVEPGAGGEGSLQFCVRDTGIGVAGRSHARLFDAFTQADGSITRRYGGTGLGLAICKRIVGLMNGRIWVESAPGAGSAFFFTLRLAVDPDQPARPFEAPPSLAGRKALVVETNRAAADALARYLTAFGLRVERADPSAPPLPRGAALPGRNGADGRLVFWGLGGRGADEVPAVHCMPDETAGDTVVIMHPACGFEAAIRRFKKRGYEHFLAKPVKPSGLKKTLRRLTEGPAPAPAEPEGRQAWPRFAAATALLVEDNAINQRVAAGMLRSAGIGVEIAPNGLEAVKRLKKSAYDLVFMDLAMPVMDGLEATRAIRDRLGLKRLPIIAMTAHVLAGDREKCLDAGMNDYLGKPIGRRELFALVRRYLPEKYIGDAPAAGTRPPLAAPAPTGRAAPENRPVLDQLKALETALTECDPVGSQRILRGIRSADGQPWEEMPRIEESTRDYDFDKALVLVRALKARLGHRRKVLPARP